ncbi:MAG TPA: TonB-dependent receptor [Chitinivibrionales bacterium]|nr:TonB-dependent receptor [Chitinivibrionales bacterium]
MHKFTLLICPCVFAFVHAAASGIDPSRGQPDSMRAQTVAAPVQWRDSAVFAAPGTSPVHRPLPKPDSETAIDRMVVTGARVREFTPSRVIMESKNFSGRYADLQSALETVSGVTVGNRGGFGHYADASIRGGSPSQVQVYLDGVPLNGATGESVDISKIPLPSLETVTVYKAAPPLEFFGDNAGGVIELSSGAKKDAASVLLEAGSFGYRIGSAVLVKTLGRMTHRLSVNCGWADNNYPYTDSSVTHGQTIAADDSQKTMDNNFFSTFSSAYSNVFRIDDRNTLTSHVSARVTNEGLFYLPQAGLNDGTVKDNLVSLVESYAATVNPKLMIMVTAKAKTDEQKFQRSRPYYLTTPISTDVSQPFGSLDGVVKWTVGNRVNATGLLSGSYDGFDYTNLLAPASQVQSRFIRLVGKAGAEADVHFLDNLSARIGGIYRYQIDSTNDSISSYGPVAGGGISKKGFPNGFSEVNYHPCSWLSILGGAQYSSRSPGFSELYSQSATVRGNPALLPETRLEYDVGLSVLRPRLALSASVFWDDTRNKIVYIGHNLVFSPMNASEVQGWGIESDAAVTALPWVTISNSVTYMENIVRSDLYSAWNGTDEPLQPRFKDCLTIKLTYKNWYASHSARFVSRYFTNFGNTDSVVQDVPQLNAAIGCTVGDHFDVSYRIENYLNVRDYDFQRPLPGLTQYAVLKCAF